MEINQILPKIKRLQKEKEWTSSQLAKNSGLSQTTVSSLYRRNNLPTIPTLALVCKAFGMSLSQFFNEYDSIEDLSPYQREMLVAWDRLSDEQQESLLSLIRSIAGADFLSDDFSA